VPCYILQYCFMMSWYTTPHAVLLALFTLAILDPSCLLACFPLPCFNVSCPALSCLVFPHLSLVPTVT
jgi:hypothetical protein